jgi:hypothetical protein
LTTSNRSLSAGPFVVRVVSEIIRPVAAFRPPFLKV